jgi:outer membrane protein OmpA-like peptidoglycan-associated protein
MIELSLWQRSCAYIYENYSPHYILQMRFFILIFIFMLSAFVSFAQKQHLIIHFDFNKSDIRKKEAQLIDSFIFKRAASNFFISLFGHTDSKGSSAYNFALSQKRVNAVKKYLIKNGFPKKLILQEDALGKTKLLLIDDADEAKGEINRRVEILFTSNSTSFVKDELTAAQITKKTIKEIIEDTSTKKGSTIILKNMQFVGGRHVVLQTSLPQLSELLSALKANPKLKISIEGHICCLSENVDGLDVDTNTQDLSMRRAKAIYEYLIYAGIDENRLQYSGLGHSVPIYPYPEKDENEKTINRRVEIKIIDK